MFVSLSQKKMKKKMDLFLGFDFLNTIITKYTTLLEEQQEHQNNASYEIFDQPLKEEIKDVSHEEREEIYYSSDENQLFSCLNLETATN